MKMIEFALSYVRKFHAVIPCSGKSPIINGWTEKPLKTEAEVRKFWNQQPYNIGLATGQICGGYIVIDLDRHPEQGIDGYEVLRDWERVHDTELPETWTAISGSGGYHFYYHTDKAMRGYQGSDGIDLRADGSQIILPPSIHPETGKRYFWELSPRDIECAEADDAVLAFIAEHRPNQNGKSTRRGEGGERKMILPPVIEDGCRHSALISLIGAMNRLGVADEAIETVVRMENRKCVPELTEQELQKEIFPAIYRFEKGVDAAEWVTKEQWKMRRLLSDRANKALRR